MTNSTISAIRMIRHAVCLLTALLLGLPFVARAEYRVLHHFSGGAADGAQPLGSLIQSGSTLYGMTRVGGVYNKGTIFKLNMDGSSFQLMHSFLTGGTEGTTPYGSLLLDGSTLYGMAGSENDVPYNGALFRISLNGTTFQVMHRFTGPPSDGRWPYDSLIQSGATLYGMTVSGGNGDRSTNGGSWGGTVFKINIDGTGYQIIHHFAGGANDGQWSAGNLVLIGTGLYGITFRGGNTNQGVIFKVNTDGTGFQVLHSFAGGNNDSTGSHGSLLLSGSTFYGTGGGGSSNLGTIFRMKIDGTDFELLHTFIGGTNDGSGPGNSVVRSGSMLYGMTSNGGPGDRGTIYQINTDGKDFRLLHTFAGGASDGASPSPGPLLLSGSTLYGMTTSGGNRNHGVIFNLDLPQTRFVPDEYPTIQGAIDTAGAGDVIQVAPGIYYENISIINKNMVLRSIDPNDPYYIGGTIIQGDANNPVLTLDNNSEACEIAGLTLRAGAIGISGTATNATVHNCRIMDNVTDGIELSEQSSPYLLNCLITANGQTGIKMLPGPGRGSPPCKPVIENCVIVDNGLTATDGGEPVIIDSIIEGQ